MEALKFFHLNFIPVTKDLALLVLRLWIGVSMLLLHGWGKLLSFPKAHATFPDPIGVGSTISMALCVGSEFLASVFLILGLFTRCAALGGVINMGVAWFIVHKGMLTGEHNGELAFIYLGGYLAIFLAGAGKFSVDSISGGKV